MYVLIQFLFCYLRDKFRIHTSGGNLPAKIVKFFNSLDYEGAIN